MFESDDESTKEIRAKTYPHIPPRIDTESYQAELADSFPFGWLSEGLLGVAVDALK